MHMCKLRAYPLEPRKAQLGGVHVLYCMVVHIQLAIGGRVKQKSLLLLTLVVENTPKINVVDSRKVSQKWDSLGATH